MKKKLEERFWSKVSRGSDDECWTWTAFTSDGYGYIRIGGKSIRVHRVAYELINGDIPEGLVICHSCDVRSCCNPKHLWIGTVADNNLDAKEKGRSYRSFQMKGESHSLSKLSDVERKNIKNIRMEGISYRGLAKKFNVSVATVHEICNGKDYSYRDRNG